MSFQSHKKNPQITLLVLCIKGREDATASSGVPNMKFAAIQTHSLPADSRQQPGKADFEIRILRRKVLRNHLSAD